MKNFPFEHEGETLWYSRSVACILYLFVHLRPENKWFVLTSKRGPGCPTNVGKWNVPGGYLDFDETPENCARRECWEETGVDFRGRLHLVDISTDIRSKSQNVVFSYYGTIDVDDLDEIISQFTTMLGEKDEVDDIALVEIDEIFKNPKLHHMAYRQDTKIRMIFRERINCGYIKRTINRLAEKYSNPDLFLWS